MSSAPVSSPPGSKRRSKLEYFLAAVLGGLGTGFFAWLADVIGAIPEEVAVCILAALIGCAAIAYAIRTQIHVEHAIRTRSTNPWHLLVVALETIVALAFLAVPYFLFVDPDGVDELIYAASLAFSIFVLGIAMATLTEHSGIKTGTELASHCWLIRAIWWVLARFEKVPPAHWLASLWRRKAPSGHVSYLVIWLWILLVGIAIANGPPLFKRLTDDPSPLVKAPRYRHDRGNGEGAQTSPVGPTPGRSARQETAEETEPSLAEFCGALSYPGAPAPEPAYAHLYAQWLGEEEGLGAMVAGCPMPAHLLDNGVWYETGTCHEDFRALALATPGARVGAILLWRPARFALGAARNGTLLGATSSRLAGEGELYTVTTTTGTSVFAREHVSDGHGGIEGVVRDCDEIKEDPIPFVRLPAALSRLWLERILIDGVWIWPMDESAAEDGVEFSFESTDPADTREISAVCTADTECELIVNGLATPGAGPGPIEVSHLLEVAPPETEPAA